MTEIILYTILSSFMFRFRGGLFGDYLKSKISWWGTTPVRIVWSAFMALPLLLHSVILFPLGVLSWWGGIIWRWSPWQYMENVGNDIPAMGLRGLILTLLPSILVGIGVNSMSGVILFVSGSLLGLVYGLNSILLKRYSRLNTSSINEYAEWIFGGVLGLAVGLLLL